jgi:hypothetical protein
MGPTVASPEIARSPLHPPDAVQLVTLFVVQDNVVCCPELTPGGDAEICTVGEFAATTDTVTRANAPPPGPLQLKVKVVLLESAGVR